MAPKKKKAVVKTTRVVKETVEVTVEDSNEDIVQVAADELVREEIIDSRVSFQKPVKTIIVEDKSPETVTKEEPEKKREHKEQADTQETEESDVDPGEEAAVKEKKQKQKKAGLRKRRKRMIRRGVRRRGEGYKIYVFRVLKQVHPRMGISSQAMTVLNNMMTDMFERLADEASRLSKYSGKKLMSSREIQGAVKLVLPGDLGKHAIAEGAKATSTFLSHHTNKVLVSLPLSLSR